MPEPFDPPDGDEELDDLSLDPAMIPDHLESVLESHKSESLTSDQHEIVPVSDRKEPLSPEEGD